MCSVNLFYPFERRLLTTEEYSWLLLGILFYPFERKVINNDVSPQCHHRNPVLSFRKKVINNRGRLHLSILMPVLPFRKKVINNPFYVKSYNKDIYNRKVSEIFHNFTVSLLPNTLLFMFHSHYFIKYSKN